MHVTLDNAVRALLASVRAGFHEVPVLTEGQKLKLDGHIDRPDDWWRLTHPVELLGL